ncbi:FAD-dependent oxidoreductase [Amycolatopsis jiangsuensis]|uniref:2-polyprenyl-6-methoxyphenol hydroxylase-like FAD-dependent oxidoreductase n=1 Tax=Amycolatopsis jiangsuensis TaxID=1181879 RepID=A0A840IUA4_9PSEU|nr:FAD-dependent oxidoreductase [Amycolatopsis jiangsuensis]MBB4685025.1 2-polyprenyl-6-methoxyphenol hydroxylase-like FAD-dependent oxidoreductase [Amycolatopsis jiangsuensis]
MRHTDVLVVGGGPTGMTVAGDLARAGRSVTVLERRPGINPSSRAFATMARTLELLDSRELAEGLLADANRAQEVSLFGGARLDLRHLRSRYRYAMITPQTTVDTALGGYAKTQGADIRRGIEVVGVCHDEDGVIVTAQPKNEPGQRTTWHASYLVAADGAHSTVRRLLAIGFPGRTVLSSVVLADVKLRNGPGGGLTLGSTAGEFGFLAPYGRHETDGSWHRAMVWDRGHQVSDRAPVGDSEVADVLRRAMGTDFGVLEIGSLSRFHCDERQVERYRHGRVFLAGDAAHVHSPMGGQGMNTGIQDAANLAWKLAAVLGGAPDCVLDTYHDERHPIGRRVLRQSGLMARGITLSPRIARGARDLVAPWLFRLPAVRDAVAGSFAGTGLRYPRRSGHHRLAGTRGTEIPLTAQRLTVVQRTPGFVLVRERGADRPDEPRLLHAERADRGPAVLVRPDGYLAWAGSSVDGTWRDALREWTGG